MAVRRDQLHEAAKVHAQRLANEHAPLLTTNYVLLEAYTRIRYDDGHRAALAFDAVIEDLVKRKRVTLAWVSPQVHARALDIFRRHADQVFSIVDCASFALARSRKTRRIFGFDRGFS